MVWPWDSPPCSINLLDPDDFKVHRAALLAWKFTDELNQPCQDKHLRCKKRATTGDARGVGKTGRFMSCQKLTLRSVATGSCFAPQLVEVNPWVIPLFTKLGYDSHRERGVEQLPSQSIGTLPIWLILALGFTPLIPGLVRPSVA